MPESTDLDAVRSALEDPEVLVWVDLYHDALTRADMLGGI